MDNKKFNNKYFGIRHGQSYANTMGIILSHLENGKKDDYTLTEEGEKQVKTSLEKAKEKNQLDEKIIIYSSPFSRCRKTAEIAKKTLGVKDDIIFDDRLRERWFGDWENTNNENYKKVWISDKDNPDHTEANAESARDVQNRTSSLILELEEKYNNKNILLVSHGDALQILQTWFMSLCPSMHRDITHLETAEIRLLNP